MRRHAAGFDPHDVVGAGVTAVAGADDIEAGRRAVRDGAGLARGRRLRRRHRPGDAPVAVARASAPARAARSRCMRTARAWAWLSGRDFVTPDDVKALAQATLAHRLVAAARGRARGRRRRRRARLRARLRPGPALSPRLMAITGRVPLLLLLGLVAVVLRPSVGTMWLWVLVVLLLVGARLAAGPVARPAHGRAAARRPGPGRAGARRARSSSPTRGRRRTTVLVRDAWQPTAGATGNRHRLRPRPRRPPLVTSPLRPTRRGDLRALGVTAAQLGPARARRAAGARATCPGAVRSLPPFDVAQAPALRLARLRDLDGRSAVRVRGQGTEFDSLREYVRGDDVRSHRLAGHGAQPQRRGPHLAARARPAGRPRARHLARLGRAGRGRTAARLGDGGGAAAGRPRRPGRRPGRRRRRRPPGPGAAAPGGCPRRRRPAARTRWPPSARDRGGRLDGARRRGAVDGPAAGAGVPAHARWSRRPSRRACCRCCPSLVRHHRVVLASVRDPELERLARSRDGLDEVYAAAAAEQALARRRRTADLLGALGVDVIDDRAERAAPGPGRPLPRPSRPAACSERLERARRAAAAARQAWVATRSSRREASMSPVSPRRDGAAAEHEDVGEERRLGQDADADPGPGRQRRTGVTNASITPLTSEHADQAERDRARGPPLAGDGLGPGRGRRARPTTRTAAARRRRPRRPRSARAARAGGSAPRTPAVAVPGHDRADDREVRDVAGTAGRPPAARGRPSARQSAGDPGVVDPDLRRRSGRRRTRCSSPRSRG